MKTGIVLLNFGEPEEPTSERVTSFLERIFLRNAELEASEDAAAAVARSRELARRRAPALVEDYEAIGGSPLNGQAREQGERLAEALAVRGHDARPYLALQFTEPLIPDAVAAARADGMEHLVALAVYPLCGPSTTVAALADLREAVEDAVDRTGWEVELREVSGWHRHPGYARLRVERIAEFARERGLDLGDPGTRLVFSVHGTPLKYLEEGSRYRAYAEEHCAAVAAELGVDYLLGYQNHANRGIPWTRPDVDEVVREAGAGGTVRRVVVDAASFVHEQSETLVELDADLREVAEEAGLGFHRVPVPHEDPRLIEVLADVVVSALNDPLRESGSEAPGAQEPAAQDEQPPGERERPAATGLLSHCRCRPGAVCTNGAARPVTTPTT